MTVTLIEAPERSLGQRMDALQEANRIRTHRAQLKRDLKAGRAGLLDLMDDPDCATMKLFDAMIAMPKFGRVKVNVALRKCTISPSKALGGLTARQQRELFAHLGERVRPSAPGLQRVAA